MSDAHQRITLATVCRTGQGDSLGEGDDLRRLASRPALAAGSECRAGAPRPPSIPHCSGRQSTTSKVSALQSARRGERSEGGRRNRSPSQ